jgi:hypothetical protein
MKDVVQNRDGRLGTVTQAESLYALVVWEDGGREELDQFDPRVMVVQRGEAA